MVTVAALGTPPEHALEDHPLPRAVWWIDCSNSQPESSFKARSRFFVD